MSDQSSTEHVAPKVPGLDPSLTDAERETRISGEEADDQPVTVPDAQPRATERVMAGLDEQGETLEERLLQEVPDVDPESGYGAQDAVGGGMSGDLGITVTDAEADAQEADASGMSVQEEPPAL